jgi:hypothetical protein
MKLDYAGRIKTKIKFAKPIVQISNTMSERNPSSFGKETWDGPNGLPICVHFRHFV